MTIDAHHHLWDLSARAHSWLDSPEMTAIRRSFGPEELAAAVGETAGEAAREGAVEGTVLVQVLHSAAETREFLAVAAECPLVRGVVGWVDLTAPDLPDRLQELRRLPGGDRLVGVRHLVQDEADPEWLLRPEVLRGLRALAAERLTFDLVLRPAQWAAAARVVREVEELSFVVDHLGKPPIAEADRDPNARREWARWLRAMAAAPNTTAKLSGLVTEADWRHWRVADLLPYAREALAAFGADRLMFGSDWPVCLLAADSYREVADSALELTAELEAAERGRLFAGTATATYGLRAAG